jgi:hypothetical protein
MVLLPIWPDASETHPIQSNSRYWRICPEPYDRFLTRLCKNFRAFSREPVSFAFARP